MKAVLLSCVAACALTSKATPAEVRYFSPATQQMSAGAPAHGRARLGRVSASSHLRYRIAHRHSPVEVELSDDERWTEQPEEYVRRAVSDALFVAGGLEQVVTGDALTVTIEVTGFEHLERAGHHYGRVQLRYQLDDDRSVIAADVVTIERESASADMSSIVAAIGGALDRAGSEIAEQVVARVAEPR
jgi:uncharacterized lipoprotein YmbA